MRNNRPTVITGNAVMIRKFVTSVIQLNVGRRIIFRPGARRFRMVTTKLNLTERQYSPGPNIDFWLLGLQILGISSLPAGFNFVVTILNLRAPGLKMMRLPTFSWMTLVTNFLIITAFPVITVGLLFLMFDRFFGTHFYVREAGATPVLWQHLFWLFGHPRSEEEHTSELQSRLHLVC